MLDNASKVIRSALRVFLVIACLCFAFHGCIYWTDSQSGRNSAKREPMLAAIDWKEGGLDPNSTNFRPEVVVLAGTYKSTSQSGFFELRMRGRDLYLRREWKDGHWWRWEIESIVTNIYWHREHRWRGMGSGGGGGGGEYGETILVPARRLWSTNKFVGASMDQLQSEDKVRRRFEEFSEIKQYGPYKIPTLIRFRDLNGEKVYRITKVLFTNQPGPEWFAGEPWRPPRYPKPVSGRNEFSEANSNATVPAPSK